VKIKVKKSKKLTECVCPNCGVICIIPLETTYIGRPNIWYRSGYIVKMCNIKLKDSISEHLEEKQSYNMN